MLVCMIKSLFSLVNLFVIDGKFYPMRENNACIFAFAVPGGMNLNNI